MISRGVQCINKAKLYLLQKRPRSFSSVATAKDDVTSSSSSSPSFKTQVKLAKTLYRQILKWTVRTGSEVPFDPMPPLTLAPPRVDPMTLRMLSLEIQTNNVDDIGIGEQNTRNGGGGMMMMIMKKKEIKHLVKYMPANTIIKEHQITLPFHNAEDIKNATRMIYKLNSIGSHHHQSKLDLDLMKDRVNLGFEVYKSLNQLSELLDARKLSREKHMDRLGVNFHVGHVVQHKTKRWRAVVGGWDKHLPKEPNNQVSQHTSLTPKVYTTVGKDMGTDGANNDLPLQPTSENSPLVEYILHLDEGDAAFSRTRVLGSTKVKQEELELVMDNDLKRVRNSLINYQFTGFDNRTMEFIPGKVLQFEYPMEASDVQNDSDDLWKEVKYDLDKHENAKVVLEGVKNIALQLHRVILDTSSCAKTRNIPILCELEGKIQEIVDGQDIELSGAISSHKLAIKYLNRLINLTSEINNVVWQRNRAKENKDRIHFPLGSVVRHKKYGFRGVVISWDPYPQTDVSNWDGLQDLEGDVNNMPFYHVIPDLSDAVKAFGRERPFRYVCQENLELCPEIDQDIEVTLDDGWSASDGMKQFIAPDILKFCHFEKIPEDEIIDACLNDLQNNINQSLIRIRNGPDNKVSYQEQEGPPQTYLCMKSLFDLLRHSECLEDAIFVEEGIKEVWKAQSEVNIRWELHDGLAHLLRGDRRTALNMYDKIVERDPGCTEAWNKKATCHYMLGDMIRSEEAAKCALQADNQNFQALAGLGLVYYETKQYDKAMQYFRKCLVKNPWSSVSSRLVFCLDAMDRLNNNANDIEQ
mmetsp:Transcript_9863/g.18550  ORF Transcript_9863/g.18550 Transcript_9863/m.18550 type:complete len:808 (+) Transcript_9863:116-2539(+)